MPSPAIHTAGDRLVCKLNWPAYPLNSAPILFSVNERASVALLPSKSKNDADKKAEKAAAQEDVLLREVDEAVRQDQYADFGKRFGWPIVGAVVLGLAAFGGYLFWEHRQEQAMEQQSEALIGALDQIEAGNLKSGSERLDPVIAEASGGTAAAARMLKAGVAMEQGQMDEAASLFAEVAADGDAPQALRDLATIREVTATYDQMKPADVVARLKPMAVPGHDFFGSAGELVAIAYLEQGKEAEAGTLFAEIAKNDDVPETLRSRARQMAGLLGVDAIDDVDELLESQAMQPAAGAAPAP